MLKIFDTLPFRAVRGAFTGLEDGMRGDIDTNEKFSDGYRENIPEKKSAAGQFLSDYSGIRGGGKVGAAVGKWGGGTAAGVGSAIFLNNFLVAGAAAGVFGGLFPLVAAVALTAATTITAATLLAPVGKYVGSVVGAAIGGIAGTAVGAYNGIFRRGYYAKSKAPEPMGPVAVPDAPQPKQGVDVQQGQKKGQAMPQPEALFDQPSQPESMTIPANGRRVEQVLSDAPSKAGENKNAALDANARVQPSVLSRNNEGEGRPLASTQPQHSSSDMQRAMQEVQANVAQGELHNAVTASTQEVVNARATQPRTHAERVRYQGSASASRDGVTAPSNGR